MQGGVPSWVRQGLPTTQGPEDLEAVPALNMPEEPAEGDEGGSRPGSPFDGLKELIGGLKLLELSFLQPSRR